jgi:hypothetical protein
MSRLALRVESPVISQGLVWYGLEHVWTALFGPTFAAGRLLQATVSAALVPVLYGFLRRFAGPRAALLGAALAAFGPLELAWGRSEYLYPYVEVYAVALAWAAYEAGESPRPAALAAVCAGMAVGGLVYPAARLLPILPLLYLPLRWRQNPSRTVSRLPCGLWLAAGCTGFLVLPNILRKVVSGSFGAIDPLSIDPNLGIVVRTGSGAAAAPTAGLATALLDSSLALARNLLLECRDSWFSEVSSLEPKTLLSPFAATFVLAGLLLAFRRRRPCDVLLLAWIALALPPALLSDNPEARRMAAAFPAFFSLAALTARDSLDAVTPDRAARRARLAGFALFAAVLLAEGVVRAGLYFEKPLGRPRASIVARGLRPFLGPGTLLVVDLNRRYRDFFEGKLYLELVDVLRTKEGGPLWAAPGEKRIASFIDAPRPEPAGPFQSISPSRADAWSRIVFVFRDVPETGEKLARVTRRHPGTTIIHRQFGADAEYMAVVIAQSPRIAAEPAPTPLRSSGP